MNGQPRRRSAPATGVLFIAIVLGFVFEIVTGAWRDSGLLAVYGAIVPVFVNDGQWWRLLTAMFLHGNGTIQGAILHLAMNLLALYQLGTIFELMFGTRRFVFIYFVTGIAASLTSYLRLPPFGASVGASGAIFGIVGALILSIRRSPLYREQRAAKSIVAQLVFLTAANIFIGMRFPQIDMAAHLGGFVAGLILGAILPHRVPPPPPNQTVIDVSPYEG